MSVYIILAIWTVKYLVIKSADLFLIVSPVKICTIVNLIFKFFVVLMSIVKPFLFLFRFKPSYSFKHKIVARFLAATAIFLSLMFWPTIFKILLFYIKFINILAKNYRLFTEIKASMAIFFRSRNLSHFFYLFRIFLISSISI